MRRFVLLSVLCALSLPVGLSVTGCANNNGAGYCSGFQSGPKTNATATIDLQPQTYGISLNFGQVQSIGAATALNCKGQPSGLTTFIYGTTSLQTADISPAGKICGGTWNRNSGNGVPDYTTCIPATTPGIAYITASGGNATSNQVPVYVHPAVTSVVLNNNQGNAPTCISQNQTSALSATVCTGNGACTPGSPDDITSEVGHLVYTPANPNILTIDQNGIATAHQPGSTVISATVAQATSTAGYFFTCPPASINLTVGTTGQTSVTVNPNNTQPLTTTVLDTQGNPITGLSLTYSSNDQINIPVNGTGAVTPAYPGDAAIVAQCLPGICNPAPQDQIANLGTGLPITSNPIQVHTPGPSSSILYMSSPQSYNFVSVDFQTGTVGTPVRLPYQPNSMVMDELGNYLFFGSAHETMIVSISPSQGAALTTEASGVPGTVLAVSPDDTLVAIYDPCRQLFYLFTPQLGAAAASVITFGAPGPAIACDVNNQPLDPTVEINPPYSAAFTRDSQTLYIAGGNTLYTYSRFTGWHTCTDFNQTGNCPIDATGVAVTVPGVGAFASGPTTTAFGYCATGPNNLGQNSPPPTGINPNNAVNPTAYYPLAATVPAATDQLAATNDGNHILGANAAGQLTDIQVTIPDGSCPLRSALQFPIVSNNQYNLNTPNIGTIEQVLVSPNSQLGFVTYLPAGSTGNGNELPGYLVPALHGSGTIVNVPLTGQAGAPIGGTFSPDTNTFYTSTSGDDLVHLIDTANPAALSDTQQLNPGLTCGTTVTNASKPFFDCTQNSPVPALFLAARPRPSQGAPAATVQKN